MCAASILVINGNAKRVVWTFEQVGDRHGKRVVVFDDLV